MQAIHISFVWKFCKVAFQRLRGLAGRVNRLEKKKKKTVIKENWTDRKRVTVVSRQVTWMTGIRSAYPGEEAS